MPITHKNLNSALEAAFPDAEINITDLAGDDDHWQAEIISEAFEGKSRITQHRMVQEAVKEHEIHALAIKTKVK